MLGDVAISEPTATDTASEAGSRFLLRWASGQYPLPPGDTLVGRSRGCQLVLDDPSISRSHALVIVSGETVRLKDLGSSNGTFVNGRQLDEEMEVQPGDRLCLGETDLELLHLSPAQASSEDFGASLGRALAQELEDELPEDAEAPPETVRPKRSAEPAPLPIEEDPMVAAARALAPEQEARFGAARAPVTMAPRSGEAPGSGELLRGGVEDLDRLSGSREMGAEAPLEETSATTGSELSIEAVGPAQGAELKGSERPTAPSSGAELLPSLSELEDFDPVLPPRETAAAEPSPPSSAVRSSMTLRPESARVRREFPPPAGFWVRLAAAAVDGLAIVLLAFIASLAVGGPWSSSGGGGIFVAVYSALTLLIPIFGWTIWGTTPGKRVFGLYVCGVDGATPLGGGRALLRFVGYFASMLSLGVGFLMIGFTASKRGLHDLIAGTYVGHRS
ncbi:MAG: FHA domain-containing protein [Acidobacteriota bacterium]